jgi:hypothetical protein
MRRIIGLIVLVTLVPSLAFAAALEKGTVELSTRFSFSHSSFSFDGTSTGTTTNADLSTSLGYSVSRLVEIQGDVLFNHSSVDPERAESTSGGYFGFAGDIILNFATDSSVIPYLLGGIGVVTYSGDIYGSETSMIMPQLQAGIRLMIKSAASVNFGVGFSHMSNALGVEDVSTNALALGVGVSVFP